MAELPVLLLNWYYYRTDITEYLFKLSEKFQLVFLHDYEKSEAFAFAQGYRIVFWNSYKTPYDLLKDVKPDKIVFCDLESFHQVSLLIAARSSRIKTFVLEHGLRGGYEVPIEIKKYYKGAGFGSSIEMPVPEGQRNKTLRFYLGSFRLSNLFSWHWMLLFIYYRKKFGLTYGLYKIKRKFRWADVYINFTERNSSYIKVRDGVPSERFRMSGNPAFDSFFKRAQNFIQTTAKPYILLLDSPFVEGDMFGMKAEEKNTFIEKLNTFAMKNNFFLKIKLHPISYASTFYMKHENISYHTHDDLPALILNSSGCVNVHFSTLMPLVILYKPYMFFDTYPECNIMAHEMNVKYYDHHNFSVDEISFTSIEGVYRKKIIDDFLYSTDGNAIERVMEILTQK